MFILSWSYSSASHLIGGNLGYEYLGQVGNNYEYKILFTIYVDCGPTSNAPNPFSTEQIGIYTHDVQNSPMGGVDKNRIQLLTVNLISTTLIVPDLPNGCTVGSSTCIREGKYEGTFTVPLNFNGFHIYADICCRNGAIDNLTNPVTQGTGFHAYIPPPLVQNSSPVFTDVPIPYLCAGDTTSILNSAYDPDGDLMVFSFVEPFRGFGTQGFYPAPPNPLTWPLDPVVYAPTYSLAQPFGPSGYSSINATTGLTQYMAPATGNYVVAVEIKEYRNGNLIGVTRRDLQLLVINCPINPPPNLDPQLGSINTQYSMEEGETLCFDFGFDDPNGDSLTLTASGQIFDPAFVNPPATITSPVTGVDTVSTQFCWTTACGQAQALPYQFQVSATDKGCPPKTTNEVFQITVNPTPPPDTITGPLFACQYETATYLTPTSPNTTYSWNISGGNIIQNNDSIVEVEWNVPGTGTISVNAINQYGCSSSQYNLDITVTPTPSVNLNNDTTICIGDTIQLNASTDATPGYTFTWQPLDSMINQLTLNPLVFPSDTTYYTLSINAGNGCIGIDSILVEVINIQIDAGVDISICFGDTTQLNATGGSSYIWSPADSLSNNFISDPLAWPINNTEYIVKGTGLGGCVKYDTVTVFVNPIPSSNPNFVLNGSASFLGGNEYQLTPNTGMQGGSAWNSSYLNLNQPFSIDVDLYFGIDDLGADGIAFILQETSTAVVSTGGTIGYGAISPSFDVEFDTYCNSIACGGTTDYGDPSSDHVAIQKNGNLDHNSTDNITPPLVLSSGNIEDGLWHNATFNWDPVLKNFEVSFDGLTVISQTIDITSTVFGGDPIVYWGFTSSTGGATNVHKFRFNNGTFYNYLLDPSICLNDSILITSPVEGTSFLWTPNTGIDDNTLQSPTFFPDTTTEYIFSALNSFGCSYSDTFTIYIDSLPIVNAGIDQSICIFEQALLFASGNAINYSWNNGVIDGIPFNPISTNEYIVTGESTEGCFNTDTVLINVNPLPNVDAGSSTSICTGDSVQLNATGASTYIWTPSAGLSDPNIPDPFASPTTVTTYTVTGTDTNGCVNSNSVTISLHNLPTATVSNDTIICNGDTAQLIASGGTNYIWSPADSLSGTVISNPLAWPSASTTYQVIISDANNCMDTAQVTVGVSNLPNVSAGSDADICFSDTIQLNASGAATYSWSPTDSLSNAAIANPLAWPSDTTQYIVTGFNALGCLYTDTIMINVNPLPLADVGPDEWICPGDNVQLQATGGAVYLWTPASGLSDPNIADPVATLTDTTTYQVEVTSSEGCVNFDTMTVFVNPNVPTDAGADTTICIGDSIQIGGNPTAVNGTAYLWSPAGFVDDPTIPNPIAFPTTPTTFYVVTSNDTCTGIDSIFIGVNPDPPIDAGVDIQICLGDTAQLNATGGISFVWTPLESAPGDTILSNDTIADPMAYPTDTTLFFVTIEDINGCVDTDSITVIVNPPPTVDAGSDAGICIGDSIQLTATGGDIYVWTPPDSISDVNVFDPIVWPIDTTEYFVTVTDSNGCINNDSLIITVHPLPIVSAGIDDTICFGDTIQLIGTGALTYLWSPNDSISDNTVAFPLAWPSDTTDYIVVGTDANGCVQSDTVNILVNLLPVVTAGGDVQICIGDSTQLNASGADAYIWTPNDSLTNAVISDPIAFPADTTDYVAQGVDLNGCINTDTVTVVVNPLPDADAGANVNICENDNTLLNATGGESYLWSPSAYLNHDTVASPLAFPDTSMMFYVQVTDSNGCVANDSVLYYSLYDLYR